MNFANFTISQTRKKDPIMYRGYGVKSDYEITEPSSQSGTSWYYPSTEYKLDSRQWLYLLAINNSTEDHEFMISYAGAATLTAVSSFVFLLPSILL